MLRNILRRLHKQKEIAVALVALLAISALSLSAYSTTETQTRYPTPMTAYYNSFIGSWLGLYYEGIIGYDYFLKLNTALVSTYFRVGIRVFIVHWDYANTTMTDEITSGTPVATVTRSINGEGLQSATWDCPETNLSRSDTVLVTFFYRFGIGLSSFAQWFASEINVITSDFLMENNGFVKLEASTWNVTYYTYRNYPVSSKTEGRLYFGNSTYATHIENIQLSDAVTETELPIGLAVGGLFAGFIGVMVLAIKKRK